MTRFVYERGRKRTAWGGGSVLAGFCEPLGKGSERGLKAAERIAFLSLPGIHPARTRIQTGAVFRGGGSGPQTLARQGPSPVPGALPSKSPAAVLIRSYTFKGQTLKGPITKRKGQILPCSPLPRILGINQNPNSNHSRGLSWRVALQGEPSHNHSLTPQNRPLYNFHKYSTTR